MGAGYFQSSPENESKHLFGSQGAATRDTSRSPEIRNLKMSTRVIGCGV